MAVLFTLIRPENVLTKTFFNFFLMARTSLCVITTMCDFKSAEDFYTVMSFM